MTAALLPIDAIITPTPAEEIEQSVLDLCATAGLPVTSWQSGDPFKTIIWAVAQVVAAKSLVEIEIARGGLGDLASPEWAKLFAQAIYNTLFVPAAPATGPVKFTNASGTSYGPFAVGQVTVGHVTSGATYRTQQDALVIPAFGSVDDVPIAADVVGIVGNALPGELKMITSLVGVTVSNTQAILGADEESTPKLVSRARGRLRSLSPLGPKGVYDFVARTPLDEFDEVDGTILAPTSTPITRTRTVLDEASGDLTTYLGTAAGAPIPADVALVQLGFDRWAEPWGDNSFAAAADGLAVPVGYQVWIRSSLTAAQVQSLIYAALITYFATVDVGGVVIPPDDGALYTETLENVIHNAITGIERVKVTAPSVEVTDLLPNQIPIVGTITPTVTFI